MTYGTADNATIPIWFGAFVFASLAALTSAVFLGLDWGDLAERKRHGEKLTDEEAAGLKRSRRRFLIWAGASLAAGAAAFFVIKG